MAITENSVRSSDRRSSVFRADIEGLRDISILLAVLFHCDIPDS